MSHGFHDSNFTTNLNGKLVGANVGLFHNLDGILLTVRFIDCDADFSESALSENVEHEVLADACRGGLEGGMRGVFGHGWEVIINEEGGLAENGKNGIERLSVYNVSIQKICEAQRRGL